MIPISFINIKKPMNRLLLILASVIFAVNFSVPTAFAQSSFAPPQEDDKLPFIRMYNAQINDHFYTTSFMEADIASTSHGYKTEGILGYLERTAKPGTKNVIRMWNPRAKKHFYTISTQEESSAKASGFVTEGTMGYIQHESIGRGDISMPITIETSWSVYRMYNTALQKHFYTTNRQEMNGLLLKGYRLEGHLGTLFQNIYKIQSCPDEWILNQMPGTVGGNTPNEYFIINGQRAELDNYDITWIVANCDLLKTVVQ